MKILIIEDNYSLAKSLKKELSSQYIVEISSNGNNGIYKSIINDYDLIILDLILPDLSGLSVCKKIREEKINTPIIILAGMSSTENKVLLLNIGADDYLTKPFNLTELRARIRALTRRSVPYIRNNVIKIKNLTIDLDTKNVSYKKRKIIFSILS